MRVKAAPPVQRPARLSTLAGTPTSRNAAALTPVRFAHEAATFTNAFSSSGQAGGLVDLGELRVDVEALLDELNLTDG